MQFCGRCGESTKLSQQYTKEMEIEEEKEKKEKSGINHYEKTIC